MFVNNKVQKINKCTYFANSGSILGKRSNLLKLKGLTLPPTVGYPSLTIYSYIIVSIPLPCCIGWYGWRDREEGIILTFECEVRPSEAMRSQQKVYYSRHH